MKLLLEDVNIHEKIKETTVVKDAQEFKNETKKLLQNEDSSWLRHNNHQSKRPILYGLPKVHKSDIPMRPVISEIAPHINNPEEKEKFESPLQLASPLKRTLVILSIN